MSTPDRRDDIDAIKALKYRYLRCVDLRLWDELAQTLAPEVTASYGKRLSYTGRDEVVAGLQQQMTDGVITEHQAHHPEIEIDGDTATGRWYLQDRVIVPEMNNGQLKTLLRDQFLVDARPVLKVSGQPFKIAEIEAAIEGALR